MAAFRFRLARALDWYRQQCEIEESRLASCLAFLDEAMGRIARLEAERLAVDREMALRSSIHGSDVAALGRYRLGAEQTAARLERERAQRQEAVNQQRARVEAARRKLTLIEKLRERRFAEHRQVEEHELETLAAESFLAKWPGSAAR
jgi:flagellar biosynthesis chaperone FliJ